MKACGSIKWTLVVSATALLTACGGDPAPGKTDATADSLKTTQDLPQGGVVGVGGKLFSIPSPVETAMLIRKAGMPYSKDLLLATDGASRFATLPQRSLALGVYGADLAYVTVHRDGQRAMHTLRTVEELSHALDLSNAFDKQLSDRFKRSINSEDSLLRFTGVAFRSAQEYLKQNSRDDVSAWILAGGWVESMYLTVAQLEEAPDATVSRRIAEQHRTLKNLVVLLENSDKEKASPALVTGLKELLQAYDGVKSSYVYKAPTVDATNKTTYLNSTSEASTPPGTLRAIREKITAIRTSIIA